MWRTQYGLHLIYFCASFWRTLSASHKNAFSPYFIFMSREFSEALPASLFSAPPEAMMVFNEEQWLMLHTLQGFGE